jgi:TolA-binding protein
MEKNRPIQLTEQDLHILVEDAVKTYLIQEGFFSNMWNGAKNVAGGAWDAAKAVGNTAGAMYYNGAANGQIQKLQQMQQQYQQKIQQIQQQIQQLQQKAQTKQQNAQGNVQNIKNRMNPNTSWQQQPQQQPQPYPMGGSMGNAARQNVKNMGQQ